MFAKLRLNAFAVGPPTIDRYCDDDHVGRRRIAAVAAELLHLVPRGAPALREAAAHVPPADDRDVHAVTLAP
jgi:hypothetical protein